MDNQFPNLALSPHATQYPGLPLCKITMHYIIFSHLVLFMDYCLNCQETPPAMLVENWLQVSVTQTH